MTREDVAEYNEEALFCDGLDEAIIGVAERINLGPVAAYSVEKIIEILMVILKMMKQFHQKIYLEKKILKI